MAETSDLKRQMSRVSLVLLFVLVAAGLSVYVIVALEESEYALRPYTHERFYRRVSTQREASMSCWPNVASQRLTQVNFGTAEPPRLYQRDTVSEEGTVFETTRSNQMLRDTKADQFATMRPSVVPTAKLGTRGQLMLCELKPSDEVFMYGMCCCVVSIVIVLLATHMYEFYQHAKALVRVKALKEELARLLAQHSTRA